MANSVLYGFINLKDVFARRVTEVGVNVVGDAIRQSVQEHDRQIRALLGLFAQQTTDFKTRYKTPSVARLQPLDEYGRARKIKPTGIYDVSFPRQMAGSAWGADYVSRVKMTVEEANDATSTLIDADMRWMRDHVLAALFASSDWTFTDEQHGALTIHGLANNDTTIYYVSGGADAGATDNHYLAQANAISDTDDPFPAIYLELTEHPENGGEVVALIPTNLKTAVMGLTGFYPVTDPNLQLGITAGQVAGTLGTPTPGMVFGYHSAKVWLVEWKSLPDNYIVATMTRGPRPLAMREEPEAELQGFKQVAVTDPQGGDSYPFWESQWLRIAGFGGWNRIGALAYRIGNASWAIPTNYTSPMP